MTRKYSEQDLEMAISNVVDGGIKIREAARKFVVPFSTLRRRVKSDGHSSKFMRPGVKPVLSHEEELNLTEAIFTFQEIGFGLTRKDVLCIAKQLDDTKPEEERAFHNSLPTSGWFRTFCSRHNLVLRSPQNKTAVRYKMETAEVRDSLFNLLEALIEKHGFTSQDIYNVDETGLQIVTKHPKIMTKKGSKNVHVKTGAERSETISIAVCANASGTITIPPFIIFKGLSLSSSLNPEQYPPGSVFAHSKSGYMQTHLFEAWLDVFIKHIPARRPILLIFDGHVSHVSYNVITTAKKNGIVLLCLPPHTSHIYQPLDVGVFRSLKSNFSEAVAKMNKRKLTSKVTKKDFGAVLSETWDNAVVPKNIKGGFRKAGIWPVDRNAAAENEAVGSAGNEAASSQTSETISEIEESAASQDSSLKLSRPTPSSTFSHENYTGPNTPSSLSTSSVPVAATSNSVGKIIREMLVQSTEINPVKNSRRIMAARCLTTDEYIAQVKVDEEKRLKKSLPKKSKAKTTPDTGKTSSRKSGKTQSASFQEIQLAEEEEDDVGLLPKENYNHDIAMKEPKPAAGLKRKRTSLKKVKLMNKMSSSSPKLTNRHAKRKPPSHLRDFHYY